MKPVIYNVGEQTDFAEISESSSQSEFTLQKKTRAEDNPLLRPVLHHKNKSQKR